MSQFVFFKSTSRPELERGGGGLTKPILAKTGFWKQLLMKYMCPFGWPTCMKIWLDVLKCFAYLLSFPFLSDINLDSYRSPKIPVLYINLLTFCWLFINSKPAQDKVSEEGEVSAVESSSSHFSLESFAPPPTHARLTHVSLTEGNSEEPLDLVIRVASGHPARPPSTWDPARPSEAAHLSWMARQPGKSDHIQ